MKHPVWRFGTVRKYNTVRLKFAKKYTVRAFCEAFNSVGAIISTLWNMGSLEKSCFTLNVFIQLFSWIYAGMKKN